MAKGVGIPVETIEPKSRAGDVRLLSEELLEKALALQLGLSEQESAYGLHYIGEKLAQCAAGLERLSDISMALVRMALEVTRQVNECNTLCRLKETQLKSDRSYLDQERSFRAVWLAQRMEVCRRELEDWQMTAAWLSEVRNAVADRIALFKRLDSDIRLQHKLLEAKLAAGAASEPGTPPSSGLVFGSDHEGGMGIDIESL